MSKTRTKNKQKRKQLAKQRLTPRPEETRAADAITVFWMVCLLATLAAEIAYAVMFFVNRSETESATIAALSNAMFLVALLCGIATLIATPVTWNVRNVAPPKKIVAFAVCVASLPILTLVVSNLT